MSTTTTPQRFPASLPEDFRLAVQRTDSELDHHLRLMASLKMFEPGQISSGKGAQLAGISRVDFLQTCGRYRVSIFNYPPEELEKEEDPAKTWIRDHPGARCPNPIIQEFVLAWDLGAGESAVISLAETIPGSTAVLDDLAARRCAQANQSKISHCSKGSGS